MESNPSENITRRCQNPACVREFLMRRPERPGKYSVNCPHCNAVNYFSLLSDKPGEESAKYKVQGAKPKVGECNDGKRPASHTPMQPRKEVKPKDGESPALQTPSKTGGSKYRGSFRCLQAATGAWWWRKTYTLVPGTHTIGALDKSDISDFMIKDDTMSPRSVSVVVKFTDDRYLTTLWVDKSLNPVYLNNELLQVGDKLDLHPGDRLILGTTIIEFTETN